MVKRDTVPGADASGPLLANARVNTSSSRLLHRLPKGWKLGLVQENRIDVNVYAILATWLRREEV